MREKKLAMIPKRTRYNYVRQRMLALILEAQEEELQNSLQQVEAPETYLDADETGSAAIDVDETMGFEGVSEAFDMQRDTDNDCCDVSDDFSDAGICRDDSDYFGVGEERCSSSDDSVHEDEVQRTVSGKDRLRRWAVESNIPKTSLRSLLRILHEEYDQSLPECESQSFTVAGNEERPWKRKRVDDAAAGTDWQTPRRSADDAPPASRIVSPGWALQAVRRPGDEDEGRPGTADSGRIGVGRGSVIGRSASKGLATSSISPGAAGGRLVAPGAHSASPQGRAAVRSSPGAAAVKFTALLKGQQQLFDMVRELTMHMRKLRAQLAVQSSKTVVPGFKLPLANPDEVVKLDRVLSEKPALAKGLKKYLTGLGLEGDGTVRVVGKVMGGILSDYAGYFLNFEGIKTGDRVVNSATQRIGLKKVAPFVHDAIESAYAEVAKELKNAAVSDLRAKTVTWFSKRKAPQRGTDAEGNEVHTTLPWLFSNECLDMLK
ncbi:hypothetical protein ONE63_010330 [Megalurothrips usitatus]|uniref:Uncharacterized protein n=1 Tax=Megalurothrips usitatus TaxID=439358 RepID=A0AAV7XIE7_9NEOP|nr:hypothetical protein ONE63_010330 [Megalurothrips usitatus]